jgi:FkbM family methyltransferase
LYLFKVILKKYANSQKIIAFDVGANVGNYSLGLQSQFPTAEIHSFEPNPSSFVHLNKKASGSLRVINMGLSDAVGHFTLYDGGDLNGSEFASLYRDVIDGIHQREVKSFTVNLTTLDTYCRDNEIHYIDFIKIDTEGHELQVLKGGGDLIAKDKIGIIQIEFNEMNVISRTYYRDIQRALPNHKFYRLLPNGLLEVPAVPAYSEIFAFQNLLGIPKNALKN